MGSFYNITKPKKKNYFYSVGSILISIAISFRMTVLRQLETKELSEMFWSAEPAETK